MDIIKNEDFFKGKRQIWYFFAQNGQIWYFFCAPSKSIKIKMSTPAFKAEAYKLFNTLIEQWESSLSPGVPTGTQLNSPQMAEAGNEEGVSYMEEGVSLRGLGL